MPNHVTNKLIVECDERAHKELMEAITGEDDYVMDFMRIIPMPKCLADMEVGTYEDMGIAALTGRDWKRWLHWGQCSETVSNAREFLFWVKANHPRAIEAGQASLAAYEETGYLNWYEWRVANWGTKWNSYGPPVVTRAGEETVIVFDTAWSVPAPILKKLSEMFPALAFVVKYFDEGYNFWGISEWRDGVETDVSDSEKHNFQELCVELKGYDPEMEDED